MITFTSTQQAQHRRWIIQFRQLGDGSCGSSSKCSAEFQTACLLQHSNITDTVHNDTWAPNVKLYMSEVIQSIMRSTFAHYATPREIGHVETTAHPPPTTVGALTDSKREIIYKLFSLALQSILSQCIAQWSVALDRFRF